MRIALHRSLTFWSGILVMAFICWAWRDSMRFHCGSSSGALGGIFLGNGFAGILIGYDADVPSSTKTSRQELDTGVEKIIFSATPSPAFLFKGSVPKDRLDELTSRFSGMERPGYSLHELFELDSADGNLVFLPH